MPDSATAALEAFFGLSVEPRELTLGQMSARALLIFLAALAMLRVAHKRFFAQRNALDVMLTLVLASTLARAINGSAALFETIAVGFLLVFAHRAASWGAARSKAIAVLVKGSPTRLIEEGVVQTATLRRHDLSMEDLDEDLRLKGLASADTVHTAVLERNGEVSAIQRPVERG